MEAKHIKKTVTGTGIFGVKRECVVCGDMDFAQDANDEKRRMENDRWFANKHEGCKHRLVKLASPSPSICDLCGMFSANGSLHKTCAAAEEAWYAREAA